VTDLKVINACLPVLPIDLSKFSESDESTRLIYRYLDFRRDIMQKRIRFRSSFIARIREFLLKHSFVDIETPSLFRRTPGGAREFLVPTHIDGGGLFYALTQSPQKFKQLLMMGGFDRYFQIAKCFRDETGFAKIFKVIYEYVFSLSLQDVLIVNQNLLKLI
jgi:aspartyl-tRNA synthetase